MPVRLQTYGYLTDRRKPLPISRYEITLLGDVVIKLRAHRQQCRSNVRLCRKNRSTCSIRQCCFDTVAGVDGA